MVTGASSGLGEALAHEFYKYGAQVVLCARRRQELERVRTDLLHSQCRETTYPPIIIPLDLSDYQDLRTHVDKILSITGRIDILVNNGGISQRGKVKDTLIEVDQKIMAVNYLGTVALTKGKPWTLSRVFCLMSKFFAAILADMLKKKRGQIVFISSVQGLVALPDRASYSASKHALQAFGDSLRAEVASENIQVTIVSPGYIKTQLSLNALAESGELYGKMDATTQSGYTPEYAAQQIVKAIITKKKELVLSTILPRIAILLRRYFPFLYFLVMELRAKRSSLKDLAANRDNQKKK